jgi:hypothetical protein
MMSKNFVATLMTTVLFTAFANPVRAGEPIPGIDIKLAKNPGAAAVAQTHTGPTGGFVFDRLAPGSYRIQITPMNRTAINTSHSNIRHAVAVVNGSQVVTIAAELGADAASADIEITTAQGKIVGTVSRAATPSRPGEK